MGKLIMVFNSTDNPITVDEDGHSVAPHDWGIADQAFVKEHLSEKRLNKVDPNDIDSKSNPAATMVKQRYVELVPPEPGEQDASVEAKAETKSTASKKTSK